MASTALSRAFPAALKEVRFHMCQSGQASAGASLEEGKTRVYRSAGHTCSMRSLIQFIESSYKSIKQSNPELPFLIREASGAPARIFARFDRGVEKHAELDGLSVSDVEKKVTELINQGGKV